MWSKASPKRRDRGPGENSPRTGFEGAEPLASPSVLHWVGWLPGTTRCGAGLAVPASPGASALRTRGVLVVGEVHINGIEGVWSLLKRLMVGTFHKMSAKHMDRYLEELE